MDPPTSSEDALPIRPRPIMASAGACLIGRAGQSGAGGARTDAPAFGVRGSGPARWRTCRYRRRAGPVAFPDEGGFGRRVRGAASCASND